LGVVKKIQQTERTVIFNLRGYG